jgi:trafficking protein particle complex subunit 1
MLWRSCRSCAAHRVCFPISVYKLHYLESATGLRFVLITDPAVGDMRDALLQIYTNIFVECVARNPLYQFGQPITSDLFASRVHAFLSATPSLK